MCVNALACVHSSLLKNDDRVSKERKWTNHFETPHRLGKMEDFPSVCMFMSERIQYYQ